MPRKRESYTIRPPFGAAEVNDMPPGVVLTPGENEIPPCPPAELPGSVYWVGIERDLWLCFASVQFDRKRKGWIRWRTPDGRELTDFEAGRELKRRGARIAMAVRGWGPNLIRRSLDEPLIPVKRPPPPPPPRSPR